MARTLQGASASEATRSARQRGAMEGPICLLGLDPTQSEMTGSSQPRVAGLKAFF